MDHILNCFGHDIKFENITEAKNCTLIDSNGNKYLDLESGVWCTSIGHCNENITKVINDNAGKFMHSGYCYNSNIVNEAAKKINKISNHVDGKCVFLCSGSEAVDLSISIAMHINNKPILLTMSDSYLSAFGNFTGINNRWCKYDWQKNENMDLIPYKEICAFIFEPGSSSGLVRFPPNDIICSIVKAVRENGGLIIANEVTTGIGRTGKWFGYNYYDFEPDMIAIGKGLGNGYPVSCISFSKETVSKIDLEKFHYGQSHQNDPLGASVALAVLNTIESENLLIRVNEISKYINKELVRLKKEFGLIKEIRNRGLMFAIEFENIENRSIASDVNNGLLEKKIILVKRPNHEVLRLDPAITINYSDLNFFIDSLERILQNIRLTTAST